MTVVDDYCFYYCNVIYLFIYFNTGKKKNQDKYRALNINAIYYNVQKGKWADI